MCETARIVQERGGGAAGLQVCLIALILAALGGNRDPVEFFGLLSPESVSFHVLFWIGPIYVFQHPETDCHLPAKEQLLPP